VRVPAFLNPPLTNWPSTLMETTSRNTSSNAFALDDHGGWHGHLLPGMDRQVTDRLGRLRVSEGTQLAHEGDEKAGAKAPIGLPQRLSPNTNLAERVGFEPTIGLPL